MNVTTHSVLKTFATQEKGWVRPACCSEVEWVLSVGVLRGGEAILEVVG